MTYALTPDKARLQTNDMHQNAYYLEYIFGSFRISILNKTRDVRNATYNLKFLYSYQFYRYYNIN